MDTDENFQLELEAAWTSPGSILDPSKLFKTIEASKRRLQKWSKKKNGHLSAKIKNSRTNYCTTKRSLTIHQRLREAIMDDLEQTLSMQEDYWCQRGRSNWLTNMDKNTSYFHHKATSRKERNFIGFFVE